MDLQRALAGAVVVEVAPRIAVQAGPFGIKASPDGKLIAVTARERGDIDFEGNTISIIDVDLARMGASGAELARVGSHGRCRRPGAAVHARLDPRWAADRRGELPDEQCVDRRSAPGPRA